MAWERRRKQTFYYRARREGSRVVKTYLGRGAEASAAAAKLAEGRAAREADAMAARALAESWGHWTDSCSTWTVERTCWRRRPWRRPATTSTAGSGGSVREERIPMAVVTHMKPGAAANAAPSFHTPPH